MGRLKMIPIYFPYTYLSQQAMQVLTVVFPRLAVYLPSDLDPPVQMQRWAESGAVELRVPAAEGSQQLAAQLHAFRSWASLQSGRPGIDAGLLKAFHSSPPFFDAPFSSQIQTDIRSQVSGHQSESDEHTFESTRLFAARVFLSIAQQLDEQADTLDQDFAAVGARQQKLLRELQSEDRSELTPPGYQSAAPAEDHQQYMLTERLEAWAQLASADPARQRPDDGALLVTCSREVLEQIADRQPQEAELYHLPKMQLPAESSEQMTSWCQSFGQALVSAAAGQQKPAELPSVLSQPPPAAPDAGLIQLRGIAIHGSELPAVLGASTAAPTVPPAAKTTGGNIVIVQVAAGDDHRA